MPTIRSILKKIIAPALFAWLIGVGGLAAMSHPTYAAPVTLKTADITHGTTLVAASNRTVAIQNFNFSPPSLTVKKGTAVTWVNKDGTQHTVTSMTGNGPNSSVLNPGQTYSYTPNAAGIFFYYCSIHPTMMGTLTVTG